MPNTIENLLTRNLLEVFGESDAVKRRLAIAALWAEDGVFVDPFGSCVGYTALNEAVSQLQTKSPGFHFAPIGAPQAFYDVGRLAWGHGPVGGPPKVTGLDVVTVRDDRIAALYAFIDALVT